jgi:hypothetical protein
LFLLNFICLFLAHTGSFVAKLDKPALKIQNPVPFVLAQRFVAHFGELAQPVRATES